MANSDQADTDGRGDSSRSGRPSKVATLIAEYDLDGVGEELERRWLGETGERDSLRDLAVVFNRRVLRTTMASAGMNPLPGEVENIYELLTDDEVSEGMRTQTRRRLERDGIDVDALIEDFVSYQAVRTYLKNHRDVEYTRSDADRDQIRRADETIQRLKSRLLAVVERRLDTLRETGRLSIGQFRVFITVQVLCEGCGTQYDVTTLLTQGGCQCDTNND